MPDHNCYRLDPYNKRVVKYKLVKAQETHFVCQSIVFDSTWDT